MTNTKTTKRALLTSSISLLLCFAMLLGTTFAWFTDNVSSTNNIIKAGNLDIELYYQNDEATTWTEVGANTNVFKTNTLWEPGHVEVVKLKVVNEGTLDLKYQLGVNVASETGSVNVDGKDFKLSDYIKYAIVDGEKTYNDSASAAAAVDATANKLNVAYDSGVINLEDGKDNIVTVVVYMPTSVTNEANYAKGEAVPTINLGINLFATQLASEEDSFGKNYDQYAGLPWDGTANEEPTADAEGIYHITNPAELVGMMDVTGNSIYIGKTIVLDADINLNGQTVKGIGSDVTNFAGTFDGQGHTISNFKIDATNRDHYAGLFNQVANVGKVENLTVKGATVVGTSMVGAVASSVDGSVINNCKAIDCTVTGVKKVGAVVGYSSGGTVTNNYAENCNVYYSKEDGGEILGYENTGSTVKDNTANNVTVMRSASTTDGLKDALVADGEVYLSEGNYTLPSVSNGDVTISGNEDTVITIDKPNYTGSDVTLNGVTVKGSGYATGIQHVDTVTYNDVTIKGVMCLYGNKVVFNNCTFDLTEKADYIWTYGAKEVEFNNCIFNTKGKAILIYNEGKDLVTKVTVKGCTFNATESALASGYTAAAIEIDSSLATNGHYTLITENNTVDSDFSGEWRIKKSGTNNTTVNETVYNAVTIDGDPVTY